MTQDTRYRTQDLVPVKISKKWICFFVVGVMCHLSCVLLSGCGYTTKSTLPSNIKTIRVEPFKNSIDYTSGSRRNIYLPLLEVDVHNAVIQKFNFDGNLKIAERDQADLILMYYTLGGLSILPQGIIIAVRTAT